MQDLGREHVFGGLIVHNTHCAQAQTFPPRSATVQMCSELEIAALVLHVATYNEPACKLYDSLSFERLRKHLGYYTLPPERSPLPPQTKFDAFLYGIRVEAAHTHTGPVTQSTQGRAQVHWLQQGLAALLALSPLAHCVARQPERALPPRTDSPGIWTDAVGTASKDGGTGRAEQHRNDSDVHWEARSCAAASNAGASQEQHRRLRHEVALWACCDHAQQWLAQRHAASSMLRGTASAQSEGRLPQHGADCHSMSSSSQLRHRYAGSACCCDAPPCDCATRAHAGCTASAACSVGMPDESYTHDLKGDNHRATPEPRHVGKQGDLAWYHRLFGTPQGQAHLHAALPRPYR